MTIAYEPVWAIGTGRSATPEIAQDTHAFIRGALAERYGEECAAAVRILYGGSVKPDNAGALLAQPDVDGALVGGASLDPQSLRGDRARRARRTDAAHRSRSSSSTASAARPTGPGNAVALARTPVFDALWERSPHTTLIAAGRAVGLPDGQMGNSEVGHLNIGAGRDRRAGSRAHRRRRGRRHAGRRTPRCRPAFAAAAAGRGVLHVAGLVSDGGVHSHVDHLRAIVRGALAAGVPRVAVHAFTDGRDVSPHQAAGLLGRLERGVGGHGRGRSRPSSGATTRWIATTAPSAPSWRARRWWTGWGSAPSRRPRRSRRATREGLTDEFITPIVLGDTGLRIARGDPARVLQLPPRPRAPDLPRAAADARPAGDDDALRRDAGRARRLRRRAAARARWPTRWRLPACASCTSPRPRSTRT